MNPKGWMKKTLSMCLVITTIIAYSMVALANSGEIAGKITFAGSDSVIVNNEAVKTGQTIFSSNTITTPDTASAVINIGKLGNIELAPKTTLTIMFNEKGINGKLATGKITVLNAADSVNIITPDGNLNKLDAGDSVVAAKTQDDDDDDDDDGGYVWIGLGVFGAAVTAAILAVYSSDDSSIDFGRQVTSPIR